MIIFAAGTCQQALDKLSDNDRGDNGVFARIFIGELRRSNESVDRVMKTVRSKVAELAKSVGYDQVPAIYDQGLGGFYFKR